MTRPPDPDPGPDPGRDPDGDLGCEPGDGTGAAAQVELDCRGMRCPLPVIELARRIGSVPPGGCVTVVADDPAARLDIPAWCRMRGQEYLGERPATDGTPSYRVRRLR